MSDPEQRLKVLAFIEAEITAGRPFPSRSAIKYHMGWKHTSGVLETLNYLATRGMLTRERTRYRWVFDLPQSSPEQGIRN